MCPSNTKVAAKLSTVKLPAVVATVPASEKVISPSKNKSCHACEAEPKSYVSSASGRRSELISAPKVTESVFASPNIISPPTVKSC